MIDFVLRKIFGSKHERDIKRLRPRVLAVNGFADELLPLSDAELRQRADALRARVVEGIELDEVLPETFALVREAGRRRLAMRHFDVQLMGGMVLHAGKIAEMATGEGKTLVATLPAVLNGLTGKGVHIVTVNDYLARRDAVWMGPLYELLGLSVAVIQHEASFLYDPAWVADPRYLRLRPCTRAEAYQADVTYGTNNEFGFDYLRDNMRFSLEEVVQRPLHYAIVDEVDSILIDEARTPLIISGPAEESTDLYYKIDRFIPKLTRAATITEGKLHEIEEVQSGDYIVDEKAKTVTLTESGVARCEQLLGIQNMYDPANIDTLHHVNQALRAHTLFKRDVDYMVKDGQVVIVDEFTGRLMPGRRWSDGLHQAVEAKEGVRIERENQTLATITFQNYFRMYEKLAGMTGTADTEAGEFAKIYKLDVVVVPTNRSLIRTNYPDVVYKTEREKFDAVVGEIKELHEAGRPVLIGTVSIEKSERLSKLLRRTGVPDHQVLNAKYHEQEAEIVAQAGRAGAVTIATNMAGRGTDILLGGNPDFLARELLRKRGMDPLEASEEDRRRASEEARQTTDEEHRRVVELGGLHILATERHESRRVDNQLRGRAGRQGDPGSSRFYLSLEDDLLRIFGSERIQKIMTHLGMEEGEPIEHRLVTRAILTAQKRVEAHHFEIRKHLLEYDDVMNKQREVIYGMRREILDGASQEDTIQEWMDELLEGVATLYAGEGVHPEDWDLGGLGEALHRQFDVKLPAVAAAREVTSREDLRVALEEAVRARYAARAQELGADLLRQLERWVMLQIIDTQWKDHLLSMDHLKEGIGLRGYGQRDPLTEYKREAFDLFQEMVDRVKATVVELLFKMQVTREAAERPAPRPAAPRSVPTPVSLSRGPSERRAEPPRPGQKVGRNDSCPCGSGKKYKKCCLAKGA
ncbi:MAG: preprotein translocase subunit SecA [Candidatus Rokuibacteriota bacterium]|nr:MAG: preprotein translocase subunit SecA [Candidatus Rokubacteria bacterium]